MNNNVLEQARKTYQFLSGDEACSGQAQHVKMLIDKLENQDVTVSMIGQFKREKALWLMRFWKMMFCQWELCLLLRR